ncbi:PLP-dependent aminotransferase family protein [Anaerolineales bacterium]|jgi:2-aminoadipate transaminase
MLGDRIDYRLSNEAQQLERSMMRELLAYAVDPDILSLAGGLPPDENLPLFTLQESYERVLRQEGSKALQYGPPYAALRAWLADFMRQKDVHCKPEQIFITNGNQQALYILSRLFADRGDPVICESIVFTGTQQVTKGRGLKVLTVPTDLRDGVDVDALERRLSQTPHASMVVLIPDYHNPLSVSISIENRARIAELAQRFGVPVVEDDAYSQLSFNGKAKPPIKAFDQSEFVFYLGSFSKMVSPALRLGWMVLPESLIPKATVIRESIDLETSTLTQRVVSDFLHHDHLEAHLNQLRQNLKAKYEALTSALNQHMADYASWTEPDGGLFVWLTLPPEKDALALLPKAIEKKVIYIPGSVFAMDEQTKAQTRSAMRLNFSKLDISQFDEALKRLASVIDHA